MPRKVKSSGQPTQGKKTSAKRARNAEKNRSGAATSVPDGGKWAGSGRKTVENREGPSIVRQRQPGRGAKTRTAVRTAKANHPNHG
jgi:hypothetical protein